MAELEVTFNTDALFSIPPKRLSRFPEIAKYVA